MQEAQLMEEHVLAMRLLGHVPAITRPCMSVCVCLCVHLELLTLTCYDACLGGLAGRAAHPPWRQHVTELRLSL